MNEHLKQHRQKIIETGSWNRHRVDIPEKIFEIRCVTSSK